jgi:hypothetical protein
MKDARKNPLLAVGVDFINEVVILAGKHGFEEGA